MVRSEVSMDMDVWADCHGCAYMQSWHMVPMDRVREIHGHTGKGKSIGKESLLGLIHGIQRGVETLREAITYMWGRDC